MCMVWSHGILTRGNLLNMLPNFLCVHRKYSLFRKRRKESKISFHLLSKLALNRTILALRYTAGLLQHSGWLSICSPRIAWRETFVKLPCICSHQSTTFLPLLTCMIPFHSSVCDHSITTSFPCSFYQTCTQNASSTSDSSHWSHMEWTERATRMEDREKVGFLSGSQKEGRTKGSLLLGWSAFSGVSEEKDVSWYSSTLAQTWNMVKTSKFTSSLPCFLNIALRNKDVILELQKQNCFNATEKQILYFSCKGPARIV